MKIWATSCLHISPDVAFPLPQELVKQVKNDMAPGDVVILAGDIVDPGPVEYCPREEMRKILQLEELLANQSVYFCPGNHDPWYIYYQPPSWWNFTNSITIPRGVSTHGQTFFGFPGFNYPGPSWSAYHHPEQLPDIHSPNFNLFNTLLKIKPTILFTHYPFWWGTEGEADRGLTDAIREAGVRHVVFGHLHNPEKWTDHPWFAPRIPLASSPDVLNVSAVGKKEPFVLVDECE
jgi:predicted phosphodiesterase